MQNAGGWICVRDVLFQWHLSSLEWSLIQRLMRERHKNKYSCFCDKQEFASSNINGPALPLSFHRHAVRLMSSLLGLCFLFYDRETSEHGKLLNALYVVPANC